MNRENQLLSLVAYTSLGAALLTVLFVANAMYTPKNEGVAAVVSAEIPTSEVNPYSTLELEAKAVYVYDAAENKVLFSRNEDMQLPIASLTKVMVALTAKDLLPKESLVTIKNKFLKEDGDGTLPLGEVWKFEDLLDLTLVKSSNDGAVAIAGALGAVIKEDDPWKTRDSFIAVMNTKAEELGLTQTYFTNETGLDLSPNTAGNLGSAKDSAVLFAAALKAFPDAFEATRYPVLTVSSFKKKHTAKNTNAQVENIPGIIASKTGSTDLAGGNLVIAFDAGPNHPIIVSVLGSSNDGRFKDVEKLVWATLEQKE